MILISSANDIVPTLQSPQNYHLEAAEYNAGNSGAAKTINWANGSAQKVTLTDNVTFTFTNGVAGGAYLLKILTGAGSFTASIPAKWSGAAAPTITATAARVDIVNFYYDGTDFFGSFSQNYTPT